MLSTLHNCSNLGVKTDLEVFSLPPTQFSHEGEEFIEYHPAAFKPQEGDNIEFFIPNLSDHYVDPSSIFLQVRARIVRSDNVTTVELPDDKAQWAVGDAKVKPDQVYPCESFINSMFKFCDIYLNEKLITQHELYAYRSFLDLLMQTNEHMQKTLWPLFYFPDGAGQTLDLSENKHGITKRYKFTRGSR